MNTILQTHWQNYPKLEPQDVVKLLYQSEFGGGHMINDEGNSLERLKQEALSRRKLHSAGAPLWEPVGGGLGRLHLDVLAQGLSPTTMNRMFVLTANGTWGTREGFNDKLKRLTEAAETGSVGLNSEWLREYLTEYERQGYPVVSHSKAYHDAYDPAYRIIGEAYWSYMEVFVAIDRLLADRQGPITVAVDGKSGSGKSSLGHCLQRVYQCGLFHMDDFFLQPHQRSPERLSEPGGNVDYERFWDEVLSQVTKESGFSYQIYDCRKQCLAEYVKAPPSRLNIVEGVYSQHPRFGRAYDLRIFLSVDTEEQTKRIRKRNGEMMLQRFLEEWIPMEQRYFDAFQIRESSDIRLESEISGVSL